MCRYVCPQFLNEFKKICILSDKLDEIKNEKCAEENKNSTITIFLELNGKIVIQERDC